MPTWNGRDDDAVSNGGSALSVDQDDARNDSSPCYSLRLHSVVSEMQSLHGLSHDDYKQYHAYCTRRLSRIRHHQSVKKDLVHSAQYVTGVRAKRHTFVKRKTLVSERETTGAGAGADGRPNNGGSTSKESQAASAEAAAPSPPPPPPPHQDVLLNVLVNAERAWAHSSELKALVLLQTTGSGGGDGIRGGGGGGGLPKGHEKFNATSGKIRQHSIQRLKKASTYANRLEGFLVAHGDSATQSEAKAYASWMRGNLALERGNWKSACEELGRAIELCTDLASLAASSSVAEEGEDADDEGGIPDDDGGGSLELRDLFTNRCQNVLRPLLKYALYEYKLETGGSVRELSPAVLAAAADNRQRGSGDNDDAAEEGDIVFRSKAVRVENKTLKVLLLKIDGLLDSYRAATATANGENGDGGGGETTASAVEDHDKLMLPLLSAYDDATHLVQSDRNRMEQLRAGPAVNAKKLELDHLLSYVLWGKLRLLMQRQEGRIRAATESAELAHLYDALLQDAQAVCALPSQDQCQEDEFWLQANANVLRIRAFRCFHAGSLHAMLATSATAGAATTRASKQTRKKAVAEAMALWRQSNLLASRASEEIAACEGMDERYLDDLEHLTRDIEIATLRLEAHEFLHHQQQTSRRRKNKNKFRSSSGSGGDDAGGTNQPRPGGLLANLDNAEAGREDDDLKLAELVPIPIPYKPAFFDIAWNHYASQFPLEEIQQEIDAKKPKQASGLLSWFRLSTR